MELTEIFDKLELGRHAKEKTLLFKDDVEKLLKENQIEMPIDDFLYEIEISNPFKSIDRGFILVKLDNDAMTEPSAILLFIQAVKSVKEELEKIQPPLRVIPNTMMVGWQEYRFTIPSKFFHHVVDKIEQFTK